MRVTWPPMGGAVVAVVVEVVEAVVVDGAVVEVEDSEDVPQAAATTLNPASDAARAAFVMVFDIEGSPVSGLPPDPTAEPWWLLGFSILGTTETAVFLVDLLQDRLPLLRAPEGAHRIRVIDIVFVFVFNVVVAALVFAVVRFSSLVSTSEFLSAEFAKKDFVSLSFSAYLGPEERDPCAANPSNCSSKAEEKQSAPKPDGGDGGRYHPRQPPVRDDPLGDALHRIMAITRISASAESGRRWWPNQRGFITDPTGPQRVRLARATPPLPQRFHFPRT